MHTYRTSVFVVDSVRKRKQTRLKNSVRKGKYIIFTPVRNSIKKNSPNLSEQFIYIFNSVRKSKDRSGTHINNQTALNFRTGWVGMQSVSSTFFLRARERRTALAGGCWIEGQGTSSTAAQHTYGVLRSIYDKKKDQL